MADNLNAAQIQALQEKVRERMTEVVAAMQLRKWAMEQALVIFGSSKELTGGGKMEMTNPIALAEQIYAFVAKPAIEFKVEA